MTYCARCGKQIQESAAFCGSCGAPVGAAAGPPPQRAPAGAGLAPNVAALLAYIPFIGWIIAIIFLVVEPYKSNKFVRFHAFQSVFYAAFCFVVYWALDVFVFSTAWIIGFSLLWMLRHLVRLTLFCGWLLLLYKAYHNERFMLPVIGELAARQVG